VIHILADVVLLIQYLNLLKDPSELCHLEKCPCCGKSGPWHHGGYTRQADRINPSSDSLNPVFIQRYYCPACKKTCSVLPECISPQRWYLWEIQQMALMLCLTGSSICTVSKKILPSRQTISRWIKHFKEQFRAHKDVLTNHVIALGHTDNMADFWPAVFEIMCLGKAMRLCHMAGVMIP